MKRAFAIALGAAALAVRTGQLFAQSRSLGPSLLRFPYLIRIAPAQLYPDSTLTPGKADTFSAVAIRRWYKCPRGVKPGKNRNCTYSKAHRSVSSAAKNAIYAEYEQLNPGLIAY
jgi:hypothetical protein